MNFISVEFLGFFTTVFLLHFAIPSRFRWILLLTASFLFYASLNLIFIPILFIPPIIIFFLTYNFDHTETKGKRRKIFFSGLAISTGLLLIFKYFNFFGNSIHSIFHLFGQKGSYTPVNIIFPIGISFYTFKTISYLADLYHGRIKAERHLGYLLLYISFFPQILAGPIDRAITFIPELKKRTHLDANRILSGFKQVVWGIFKKVVIADRLAVFVNNVFQNPEGQGINLIFGAYFFAFQIYCDFSGYSDIAIGISRILGYKSMENFNFPYFSKTISEFWTRWHISLSTWLRDYLFLPIAYFLLGKYRKEKTLGMKTESLAYVGGMFITMFLGGLWHGAGWTFVVWGVLHGVYLSFSHISKRLRKKLIKRVKLNKAPRLHKIIKIFITFNLVTFAWIFFRASGIGEAWIYIKNINFGMNGTGAGYIFLNLILILFLIVSEFVLKNRQSIIKRIKIPLSLKVISYAIFICLIIILFMDQSQEFIYFGF